MKIIDAESYDNLMLSITDIMGVTNINIKSELSKYPNDLSEDEFIEKVYKSKFYKGYNYDGIYLFHLTRCTDNMLFNIKENGLLPPLEAITYIKNDITNIFELKHDALNFDNSKLIRNPVDNSIYAMQVNISDKKVKKIDEETNYHFLDKQSGPEYVRDILDKYKEKYGFALDYFNYTKPYIIKIFIKDEDLEKTKNYIDFYNRYNMPLKDYFLLSYLYILYIFLKNMTIRFSGFICNKNVIEKIILVEE